MSKYLGTGWRSTEDHHPAEESYPLGSIDVLETHSSVKSFCVIKLSHWRSRKRNDQLFPFLIQSAKKKHKRTVGSLLLNFIWTFWTPYPTVLLVKQPKEWNLHLYRITTCFRISESFRRSLQQYISKETWLILSNSVIHCLICSLYGYRFSSCLRNAHIVVWCTPICVAAVLNEAVGFPLKVVLIISFFSLVICGH